MFNIPTKNGRNAELRMDIKQLLGLVLPLILVFFGFMLRKTRNEKYQFATKYWRLLVALGLLSFLLKVAAFLLS